jgi:pimeloyl-ACP methyl ester carboxylesterase
MQNPQLPIDPTNEYPGNFSNRYWVLDEFFVPGGPVIAFDLSSQPAEFLLPLLTSPNSFFTQYLRQFKALGLIWEHRYYGESYPFPTPSAAEMRFLTVSNALQDFATFANSFRVSPRESPWVVIGASYGGSRAAALRRKYPEIVFAAYAISAPIFAVQDMSFCTLRSPSPTHQLLTSHRFRQSV